MELNLEPEDRVSPPSKKAASPVVDAHGHFEVPSSVWGRRDFLTFAGWSAFGAATLAFLAGSVRFFFPRVVYEAPLTFKAGYPEEYPRGTVSTKWQKEYKTVIIREERGEFYALKMSCTHLGCTPIWSPAENKFKCPCHGSGFDRSGVNIEGPAPRSLERFEMSLAEDGQIVVNRGRVLLKEQGEWDQSLLRSV